MGKMVLVVSLAFILVSTALAEDEEFVAFDLYGSMTRMGEYYRNYCIGVGATIEYFANQQRPEGRGVNFGELAEFTLAADRWIKQCSPYLEYERKEIDIHLNFAFGGDSKQ